MRFLRGRRSLLVLVADVLAICSATGIAVAVAADRPAVRAASSPLLQSAPLQLADVSQGSGLSTLGAGPTTLADAGSGSGGTATPIGGVTLTHGGRSEVAEVSRGSGLGMKGPGPTVPAGALPVPGLFTATSRT
jgi:hypothetical protein